MTSNISVGRSVHYVIWHFDEVTGQKAPFHAAATVTDVHQDGTVDLFVVVPREHFHRENVSFADPEEAPYGTWHWPEFVSGG